MLVQCLKQDASPGFPLCNIAGDKGKILEIMPGELKKSFEARFRLLNKEKIPDSLTAQDLVELGYCDPVKIFVKNEPHPAQKVRDRRFRLISSISMLDEMLDRVAFMVQNREERDHWGSVPSACGMGFTDEHVAQIISNAQDINDVSGLMATDISGWDFGVSWFEYEREIKHRVLLANAKGTPLETYIYNLIRCRSLSVFVLSDGDCFAQTVPGIMKSGWYCTSSSNSRIRNDVHYLIGGSISKSNGDDCLANRVPDVAAKLLSLGHICVEVPTSINRFEFCSHIYENGIAYTTNAPKITFALLGKTGTREQKLQLYADFLRDLENLPEKERYTSLVKESGWLPGVDEEVVKHTLLLGSRVYKDQNGFRAKQNAERLHGSIRLYGDGTLGCTVPFWHVVSNTMPNRRRNKQKATPASKGVKALRAELQQLKLSRQPRQRAARNTPFSDAGAHLGGMFGFKDLGKGIGGVIGRILGSGDYMTNFSSVQNNALTSKVPSFGGESTIITHREYLKDVISSPTMIVGGASAFKIDAFRLNPTNDELFPWLATIAQNFEEYSILGMIFEFKSMSGQSVASTNTALGSVILTTQYDPTKPAFTSKQQMENYFFSQSTVPSNSMLHAIECKSGSAPLRSLYTSGGTSIDPRFVDYGTTYLATVGLPAASINLGELWVSYKIELKKPRLPGL